MKDRERVGACERGESEGKNEDRNKAGKSSPRAGEHGKHGVVESEVRRGGRCQI